MRAAASASASVDLDTTDNVSAGKESSLNFAWQAGVGLDYQLTDTTTFSLGWRYVSMGADRGRPHVRPGREGGNVRAGPHESRDS